MELFFKCTGAVLLACVLSLVLREEKDLAAVLTATVCVMVFGLLCSFLEPVLDFLKELQALGDLNGQMLQILLKCAGVGIVTEVAAMVCQDCANASLGKCLQLLGTAVILWLSLPMFQMLLTLMEQILGDV